MPVKQFGRRHFLMGTGAVLSIPFLPSLAPKVAKAQAFDQRFFIAFQTMHGGVWPEHMWPSDQVLDRSHQLYSDHTIRYGALPNSSSLSPVLSSSGLSQSVRDKMMLIRGLDVGFYLAHNTGGALGNYERRDGNKTGAGYVPTIDQVLAYWSGFYGGGDPYVMRSMHVGDKMSYVERSSGIQAVDPAASPDVLFRTVLSGAAPYQPPIDPSPTPDPSPSPSPNPEAPAEARTHVLNRVVEHYNRLVNGSFGDARRLSANDKARLNDHMDLVSDLAGRLDKTAAKAAAASCEPQSANSGNTNGSLYSAVPYSQLADWHQDYNAVFAAAVACGASRIATVRVENTFHQSSKYWNDAQQWHEPIAHRAETTRANFSGGEHPQDVLVTAKNNFYRDGFVDMVERLDQIDAGDGTSLLDKGLVMWTQECGPQTHMSDSIPVITAGSVDGYFNTGQYFDFRNRSAATLTRGKSVDNAALYASRVPGILYNQWLSNILQSMGMSSSQFSRSHPQGWAGYGHANIEYPNHHPSRLKNDANKKIPKVTSGT